MNPTNYDYTYRNLTFKLIKLVCTHYMLSSSTDYDKHFEVWPGPPRNTSCKVSVSSDIAVRPSRLAYTTPCILTVKYRALPHNMLWSQISFAYFNVYEHKHEFLCCPLILMNMKACTCIYKLGIKLLTKVCFAFSFHSFLLICQYLLQLRPHWFKWLLQRKYDFRAKPSNWSNVWCLIISIYNTMECWHLQFFPPPQKFKEMLNNQARETFSKVYTHICL